MADDGRINFTADIDTDALFQQVDAINAKIMSTGAKAQEIGSLFDAALANITKQAKDSAEQINRYDSEIRALRDTISETQGKILNIKEALAKAKDNEQSKRVEEYTQKLRETQDEMARARQRIAEINNARQDEQNTLSNLKQAYKDFEAAKKESMSSSADTSGLNNLELLNEKLLRYKETMKDANLNDVFTAQNTAIQSVSESVQNLSQSSQQYATQAQTLQETIRNTVTEAQQAKLFDNSDASKETLAQLKDNINQYRDALLQASASAQAAYQTQQEAVTALRAEIESLTQKKQEAAQAGNTEAVSQLQGQIDALNGKLKDAEKNLSSLKTQADNTNQALSQLPKEVEHLNQAIEGLTGKNDFFESMAQSIEALPQLYSTTAEAVKRHVSDMVTPLKTKVTEWVDPAKQKITEWAEHAKAKFSEIANSKGLEHLKGVVGGYTSQLGNWFTGHGKFMNSLGDMKKVFESLPIPMAGATKGVVGLTAAMLRMAMTPLGAVITALALGLKAVHTWLTSSEEGQMRMAKTSAYFGSILRSLTDIVVIIGGKIMKAFDSGPLTLFAKNIKVTLVSAFKAVYGIVKGFAKTISGVFSLSPTKIWDGIKDIGTAFKDAAKTAIMAVASTATGVIGAIATVKDMVTDTSFTDALNKAVTNMGKNAQIASDAALDAKKAQLALNAAKEKELETQEDINKLREKVYTLTGQEKLDALAELKKLQANQYKERLKAQKDMLEAHKKLVDVEHKENSLHAVTLEDLAKQRELRMEILQTQAQQAAATRFTTRMEESTKRGMAQKAENERKAQEREEKRQKKQAETAARQAKNQANAITTASAKLEQTMMQNAQSRATLAHKLEEQITDAQIAGMREGSAKVQAQRKRELDKALDDLEQRELQDINAEVEKQRKEYDDEQAVVKAQGGKIRAFDIKTDVDQEEVNKIREYYTKLKELAVATYNQSIVEPLLSSYQDYTAQRLEIEQKFDEDIRLLTEARQKALSEGDEARANEFERAITKATAEKGKSLMSLQFEELKKNPDYIRAFEDLGNTSTETLTKLLDKFNEAKLAAAQVLNPEDLKEYTDVIRKILDELESRDVFGALIKSREDLHAADVAVIQAEGRLREANNKLRKAQDKVSADGSDLQARQALTEALKEQTEAEDDLRKKQDERAKAQSKYNKAVDASIREVDKLTSALTNVGNAIGGEAGEIIKFIAQIGDFAKTCMQGVKQSAEGTSKALQTIEKASVILAIVSAAIQLLQQLDKLLPTAESKYKEAADKQKQINKLSDAVNEYRKAVMAARNEEKNWFADNNIMKLRQSAELSAQAYSDYVQKLTEEQETYQNESGQGWLTKFAHYTNPSTWLQKLGLNEKWADALSFIGSMALGAEAHFGQLGITATEKLGSGAFDYSSGKTAAMNNLRIETRKASNGWLGTGLFGHSQETEDIQSWINENAKKFSGIKNLELFDKQGMINAELAQTIIDKFGDDLVGETKETMEALLKLKEEYDQYQKDLKEFVSDLYSPLVDNFVDSMWAWFDEGKDALKSFKDAASDTFRDIVSDMMRNIALSKIFDNYQDQIKDVYDEYIQSNGSMSEEELMRRVGNITQGVLDRAETQIPTIQKIMENIEAEMNKHDLSLYQSNGEEYSQNATTSSLDKLTQDQGEEISGRLGGILNEVSLMNDKLSIAEAQRGDISLSLVNIRISMDEIMSHQQDGLDHLAKIEKYTAHLPVIADDIRRVRETINP